MTLRIIIYGNSGSGKTTLARQLQRQRSLTTLDLDNVAWEPDWGERRPLEASIADLRRFIAQQEYWIIEGCYGNLIDVALKDCTDLRFLNPGIEACVANCRSRYSDWKKHQRPEDERSPLEDLIPWVRNYEQRNDEFSLARHRAIFDRFDGQKTEYNELPPPE
jgi:adenylate kinase family enzyme